MFDACAYLAPESELLLEFTNGAVFRYRDVPLEIARDFYESASPGRFYNACVKGKFPSERLDHASDVDQLIPKVGLGLVAAPSASVVCMPSLLAA